MLKLVGTDGSRYYSWALEPGRYVVGRQPACDFTISDKTVSRRHAELEVPPTADMVFLDDLGSHNGTMLNGKRIGDKSLAKIGDRILFGFAEFKLTLSDENVTTGETKVPTTQLLTDDAPEQSVYLSINEALKPLPSKVTDLPEVMPALFEMAKQMVLPEPQSEMFERSLKMIAKAIPAERLAILFTKETPEQLYTAALHAPGGKDTGDFKLSRTVVSEILENQNSVLIGNPEDDPRFTEQHSIIMSELKSVMAVPLFEEGKVFGILYADTTNPLHRYNDDYLRLFATFGNLIAFRILNYSLLAERHEKELMDAEIRRATIIQGNLLARELPEYSGYKVYAYQEQCRAVGGDLYDVRILPDNRMLFTLGDVSGKGMGAALLMSNIMASFRILYEDQEFDICRAVERVSNQLWASSSPEDFATLFLGVVDNKTNKMAFVNAGHNPPYLVRKDGRIEELEASGCMIGAFNFASWAENSVELNEGDVVVVFTDGVVEAEKDDHQMYKEERLQEIARRLKGESPREISRGIMEDIRSFIQGAPQSDDITMLILKREQ